MKTEEIARYIIAFLLGEEDPSLAFDLSTREKRSNRIAQESFSFAGDRFSCSRVVGYTRDLQEARNYRVVIFPCGFFDYETYGRPLSMPVLPLLEWRGTPLLFGSPKEEWIEGNGHSTLILYADLVASTYFLISRYEEMFRRHIRDDWGRFPGKESLPYKAGFIERPVVDEYASHLQTLIKATGIPIHTDCEGFRQVNLTHDIDQPYEYRGVRGFLRAFLKENLPVCLAHKKAFSPIEKDRYFSFPRFLEWNKDVAEKASCPVHTIFFYKTPGTHPNDKPNYKLSTPVMRRIRRLAAKYGVVSGLHVNLTSSLEPERIEQEVTILEKALGEHHIEIGRYHYLACREPEDFLLLRSAGIRHDYTMGYADVAGFRLGTTRPVRFIFPSTGVITDLILHPLFFMDYTLQDGKYMGIDYPEALELTTRLITEVYKHRGELNLLFHNENLSLDMGNYQVKLYRNLLRHILFLDRQTLLSSSE